MILRQLAEAGDALVCLGEYEKKTGPCRGTLVALRGYAIEPA